MENQKGFTLNEILITLGIISVLSLISVFACLSYFNKAKASECLCNRIGLESAERRYNMDNNTQCLSVSGLAGAGYLRRNPVCSSHGQYFWISQSSSDTDYPKAGCTVHLKE